MINNHASFPPMGGTRHGVSFPARRPPHLTAIRSGIRYLRAIHPFCLLYSDFSIFFPELVFKSRNEDFFLRYLMACVLLAEQPKIEVLDALDHRLEGMFRLNVFS